MTQDRSVDYVETLRFLDRRFNEVEQLETAKREVRFHSYICGEAVKRMILIVYRLAPCSNLERKASSVSSERYVLLILHDCKQKRMGAKSSELSERYPILKMIKIYIIRRSSIHPLHSFTPHSSFYNRWKINRNGSANENFWKVK